MNTNTATKTLVFWTAKLPGKNRFTAAVKFPSAPNGWLVSDVSKQRRSAVKNLEAKLHAAGIQNIPKYEVKNREETPATPATNTAQAQTAPTAEAPKVSAPETQPATPSQASDKEIKNIAWTYGNFLSDAAKTTGKDPAAQRLEYKIGYVLAQRILGAKARAKFETDLKDAGITAEQLTGRMISVADLKAKVEAYKQVARARKAAKAPEKAPEAQAEVPPVVQDWLQQFAA